MAKTLPVERLVGSPYGIDCDRVTGRGVSWCGGNGVVCRVGGCGEPGRGGVKAGGGGVSWQIDGGVMDEDGAVGGIGGS